MLPQAPAASAGLSTIPLVLEPVRVPLGQRLDRATQEAAVLRREGIPPLRDQNTGRTLEGNQIRTRDGRAQVGPPGLAPRPDPEAAACAGADALRGFLAADPQAARASLHDLIAGFEPDDPHSVRALRDGFLAAGLGAEAAQVARAGGLSDPWRDLLADVLDDVAGVTPPEAAWRCGPETTLLALAIGPPPLPPDDIAGRQDRGPRGAPASRHPHAAAGAGGRDARIDRRDGGGGRDRGPAARSRPADALARTDAAAGTLADRLGAGGGAAADAAQDALALLPTLPEGGTRD